MLIHRYQDTVTTRHVASFNSGITNLDRNVAIRKWCWETFGPTGERWRDQTYYGEVDFRDESDLLFFLLRWQ